MFKQAAIAHVNRFLDVYRDTTGFYWVKPISTDVIPIFNLIAVYEDDSRQDCILATLGTGNSLGYLIKPEQDVLLRKLLESFYTLDNLQRLAFAALDAHAKGDYWTAAVGFETFFEAKVARIFRLAFKNKGLPDTAIDAKFEKTIKNKKGHAQYTLPKSIDSLVKSCILEFTGISLEQKNGNHPLNAAYEAWWVKARGLRNDIAHGKSINVSEIQAGDVLEAVKNFLEQIQLLLPDQYPTKLNVSPSVD